MNRRRWKILVLGLTLLGSAAAHAQAPRVNSLLERIGAARLQLHVVSGRIVNTRPWHFGNGTSRTGGGVSAETITFRGNGVTGSLSYKRESPQQDMSLEINSEGRFSFRRASKETKEPAIVEFLQAPNEPIVLTIDRAGRRETYRSPTLWHLLVTQPEVCRQHVMPLMEVLRRRWQIDRSAAAVEGNLLRMAGESRADRRQWDALVEQLGDSRFAKREAADRQLREAGPFVMAYLAQLDVTRLDAEQQFRIRRIVSSMSRQTSDDDPEQAAASLVEDPTVWLALSARADASTRRLAVARLAAILGEPIAMDPAADPATQSAQREQLRAKIEKRAEGKKRAETKKETAEGK